MKKIPLRMCVGCRQMKQKDELVRVVHSPEGTVNADATFKAPGRGAYICRATQCLELAVKNKALSRAFKKAIPEEVYTSLRDIISDSQ